MTASFLTGLLAWPLLLLHLSSALQVTPNSPCASLCIDSTSLDPSDPNSSNTYNSDIVCEDADYASSAVGVKWQNCMSCLQNSTFSQGQENDQMWFLYNMRYNVDYCLFGFPNATGIGSSPCTTSTACGPLEDALEDGNLNANNLAEYSYCSANGSAMTGDSYSRCLTCISAGGDTNYLANYIVALEAGCLQEPPPGKIVGLSGSVFSTALISIVSPSNQTSQVSGNSVHVPVTIVVPVVIAALLLIAAVAAFIFIRHRKRENRRARARGGDFLSWRHRRKSSLSFRCQTQMGPLTPKFFPGADDSSIDEMTYAHTQHNAAGDFNAADTPSIWSGQHSSPSLHEACTTDNRPQSQRRAITSNRPPHHLKTTFPTPPPNVHQSPSTSTLFSPESFTSPASAVSTKSTTPMLPVLRPYNPADHAVSPPGRVADSYFSSPVSASTASPLLRQQGWSAPSLTGLHKQPAVAFPLPPPPPPPPPPAKSPRLVPNPTPSSIRKGKAVDTGSPVESEDIKVSFAPPPRR